MARTRFRSPFALAAAAVVGSFALVRARRRMSLRGSVVLITGGSRGLGLVLARELADAGANVAICARDEGELDAARRELEGRGADVLAVPCDVTDSGAVERMIDAVEDRFGPIDVLVNNASIIQVAPAETLSMRDLHAAMAANFWGMVHATMAVLPGMRERRSGRIVNVTSIGGTVAVPHLLGYTSAKFAAVGFSMGTAVEAAKDGVTVSTIVPGLMRTGSFLHALVKGRRADEATLFSTAASLPFLTVDARRAARRIVRACERGEGFVTIGLPWKLVRVLSALAPNVTADVLSIIARMLPGPGDDRRESEAEPSYIHRRGAGHSVLTTLGDRAASRNNEQPVYRH